MAELRREQLEALRRQREEFMNASVADAAQPWWILPAWLFAFATFTVLLFLSLRLLKRINLPPFPILVERGLMRLGIQPPKALHAWARRAALAPIARALS